MVGTPSVDAVVEFLYQHGPALLACWLCSTFAFWWLGGFAPKVHMNPPARARRMLTVSSAPNAFLPGLRGIDRSIDRSEDIII